jgi:squalene-hopene/tetraprenyl-beta-curcumene cyclase
MFQTRKAERSFIQTASGIGLMAATLEASGTNRDDATLRRALEWLDQHQGIDGAWRASSLNMQRDPDRDIGRFMNDAATAYAVPALKNARLPSRI